MMGLDGFGLITNSPPTTAVSRRSAFPLFTPFGAFVLRHFRRLAPP